MLRRLRDDPRRNAVAVVELAVVLPLLVLLVLIAVDYCRLFHYSQVVNNCARNGAMYASDPYSANHALYSDVETAARADADLGFRSQLTVTTDNGSDTSGNYVRISVTYPFRTLTGYPGIPRQVDLTRTVQTRLAPAAPK